MAEGGEGQNYNQLRKLFEQLTLEKQDTNFVDVMIEHVKRIDAYYRAELAGRTPWELREEYYAFCASRIAVENANHMQFNTANYDNSQDNSYEGKHMPPLKAFHYTNDEKERNKELDFQSLVVGDVLHLKVVDEDEDKYKLQILNKYGEKNRIVDSVLFADLIKNNDLVKKITPPLKQSDLVRAVVFGKIKLEAGVFANRLITLNSKFITRDDLKDLKLGRVLKKDIPYYPEDISGFSSFGAFLEAQTETFESPTQINEHISALGCDPLKTGPFYGVRTPKQIPHPIEDSRVQAVRNQNISEKTAEAEKLLCLGDLNNAFKKIDLSLSEIPDDSKALTVKGKTLLALSDMARPVDKVKAAQLREKAYSFFVEALKVNHLNAEAAAFHDSILRNTIRLNPTHERELKSRLIMPNCVDQSLEDLLKTFMSGDFQQAEGGATVKTEKMDI